jgi:hypothetical protein
LDTVQRPGQLQLDLMPPYRRVGEADKPDFYAAAIYGSILAAALLAPFHEEHVPAADALAALLSTAAVFWLAHAWSTVVAERIHSGLPFSFRHALEIGRSEWPLIEAALVPSFVLLLGWVGVLSNQRALTLAIGVCIVQLLAWGFVVGHRAYHRGLHAVAAGLANGALGVGLVALEVAVVHR